MKPIFEKTNKSLFTGRVLFEELLRKKRGLCYKADTFERLEDSICVRLKQTMIKSVAEYYEVLLQDDDELSRLINLLTVNETYFMREPRQFQVFVRRLVPQVLSQCAMEGRNLRILSVGCSSGEEPCSILIALARQFGAEIIDRVEISGIDINSDVIQSARLGIFSLNSFRGIDRSIQKEFFVDLGNNRFSLIEELQGRINYSDENLVDLNPLPGDEVDFVFFRNVLIFFERDGRQRIFNNLARTMVPSGYLFTSSVETSQFNLQELVLREIEGVYLFQKESQPERNTILFQNKPKIGMRSVEPKKIVSFPYTEQFAEERVLASLTTSLPDYVEKLFSEALELVRTGQTEIALEILEGLLNDVPDHVPGQCLRAEVLFYLKLYDEAKKNCIALLEWDEWNLECHLLLGLIAKIHSDIQEALNRFRNALFIESTCWLAHFYLAEIFYDMGSVRESYREYGIALRLLEKNGLGASGLSFFPLSCNALELIHLCRYKQQELEKQMT